MSEEVTVKLNERRYSLRTAAKLFSITDAAIYYRAKKLGFDTSRGLTAKEIKIIQGFCTRKSKKGDINALKEELEAMG